MSISYPLIVAIQRLTIISLASSEKIQRK